MLKNQLYQQSQVKKASYEKELTLLAAGKKSLWDTKTQGSKKLGQTAGTKNQDNAKISNLL